MNHDDILRMAKEAGMVLGYPFLPEHLERFAALVAAAEREECARVAERFLLMHSGSKWDADHCAAAIRARSNV